MHRLASLVLAMILLPQIALAGYIFQEEIDSDGQKSKVVLWVEGKNKRMDVYMDGQLYLSMVSNEKRNQPLYVMHDSETYMNKLPGTEIPTEFPQMEYEPPKQPVNPAEKVVDAMERTEKTQQRIEDFKNRPWDAAYETMLDAESEVADMQHRQMMKKQMAQVKEMQKQMKAQMEGHMKQMKGRMQKNKRLKNAIKASDFSIKPTSKKKKIDKYNARLIQVYYKGKHYQDVWTSKKIGAEVSSVMNSFHRDTKINGEELKDYYETIAKVNEKVFSYGFPILIESNYQGANRLLYGSVYDASAPKKVTVRLKGLEKKKIKEAEFKPPKNYEEVNI